MADANFFWYGSPLSLYERACISSFVRNGFKVSLHTFDLSLAVPEGVSLQDASLLAKIEEVTSFTQGGQVGSIAAFSDIIRYRILAQRAGWWFDTDVYCLRPAGNFERIEQQSPGLVVGNEAPGVTNGAVMCVSDTSVASQLLEMAKAKGKVFAWGEIGPRLVAEFCKAHPKRVRVLESGSFYPISLDNAEQMFLPEYKGDCRMSCNNALSIHLWNEYLRRMHVPKTLLPPRDSFLWELFVESQAQVSPHAAMEKETYLNLRFAGGLTRLDHAALRLSKAIKAVLSPFRF